MTKNKTALSFIASFFLPIFAIATSTSCSSNEPEVFSVESSKNTLEDNGWSCGYETEDEDDCVYVTKLINADISDEVDFEIGTIVYYAGLSGPGTLSGDDPNWVPPRTVQFIVFGSVDDAANYYGYLIDRAAGVGYSTRNVYISLYEDTYVDTNSEDAKNLIPLEFTLV